eukprot:1629-Heterocapsa_arctica.AAC.1
MAQQCIFKAAAESDAAGSAEGAAPRVFIKQEQLEELFPPPGSSAAGSAEGAAPVLDGQLRPPGFSAAGEAEEAARLFDE